MALGKRIRTARKNLKWSRKTVADHFGVDPSTVWRWEADDSTPSVDILARMARLFGVRPAWLMCGDGKPKAGEDSAAA